MSAYKMYNDYKVLLCGIIVVYIKWVENVGHRALNWVIFEGLV